MDKPLNDDSHMENKIKKNEEQQLRASKNKFNKISLNAKRTTPSQASKLKNRLNKEDDSNIRVDASQSQSPPGLRNQQSDVKKN